MPRFKLRTFLCFRRIKPRSEVGDQAMTINISTGGLYFATTLVMPVGEAIEILTEMPERITGAKPIIQRFTGRVAHVESKSMPQGHLGIGVQLLCYERWTSASS
jgi:Tfp pilus assembly protein PilZ